ncbi:unnamed protein product, partial [marine sediment metagenome]
MTTSETKICTKCYEEKPLGEFHKDSNAKDKHHFQCKHCCCLYSNEYNKLNPEKVKAAKSTHHIDPEKLRLRKERYRKRNRKQIRIQNR